MIALDLFFSLTTFYWSSCLAKATKILRKLTRICLTQTHLSMVCSLHDWFRSPFGLLFDWIKLRKVFKILSKRVQRSQDKNIYYVAEMGGSSWLEKTVPKLSNKMLNLDWIFTQLKAKDTVIQMRITFWKLDINFKQLTNSDRRNKIEVVLYRSPITTTAQSNVDHGPLVLVTFFRHGN